MLNFPEGLETDWRFEYKYRLTYAQYIRVRSAVLPYMKKDVFTKFPAGNKYLVRSLYFDTHDLRSFVEKVNGDCNRVKLRIRTYQNTSQPDLQIRVELKARKGMAMEKHSTWVSMDAFRDFISSWHWQDTDDPVLAEFERYVHLKTLRPKILVEYQREGYLSRIKEEVRVTFDHHVKSARASSLFPESPFFRNYYPGMVVFEIKCDKRQPLWLRKLAMDQGLCFCANSKFTQGIEMARPDVVRATWSDM